MVERANSYIPYGRQLVEEEDVAAVIDALRSDWLTCGPKVPEFERAVSGFAGAKYGVAVNSGTAALHTAMHAIGIRQDDEVIVAAMTFAATANAVEYQGGRPVFVDVQPDNLLLDPDQVKKHITQKTKAIIAVDYAGHPCDYDTLRKIAHENNLHLVADSCHALGAEYKGQKIGELADLATFSFHPVKHIATGEGGMVICNDKKLAEKMSKFRNHGISTDLRQREEQGTWYYEMTDLGFNYRIPDLLCALGLSQLKKMTAWLDIRRQLAGWYDEELSKLTGVKPLMVQETVKHAYHLYVTQLRDSSVRQRVFNRMREDGIGVNVHYLPVYLHPYYLKKYDIQSGLCPVAESAYEKIISLPMHHALTQKEMVRIVESLTRALVE